MEGFLENKFVRNFNVYIAPMLIGGIFSAMGQWDYKSDNYFIPKLVALIILLVWYAISSYKYHVYEKKDKEKLENANKSISDLKEQNEGLKEVISSYNKEIRELTSLFYDSSKGLNELSHFILEGNTTLDIWNYKKVATSICNSLYVMLCEICKPFEDFSVNIMLVDITAKGSKKNITMIAHKGKYEDKPRRFEEKMLFSKYPNFYAIKLCKENKTDIKILTTSNEVNEKFVYVDEEHPKYSQYIGVPIVCSGNKIVSLLQICAFKDAKIANTKSDIMDVVTQYVMPYTELALLSYKIEKSLISSLSLLSKRGEKENGSKVNEK